MHEPTIEIIPIKNAARADQETILDFLIRITPPTPEIHFVRPPINLGLVLDRSGSMAGAKKIDYARKAARLAVEQLLPTDRLSITIFDDSVETIAPNRPVTDKPGLIRMIDKISPRNSTALHAGWKEGGEQVRENLIVRGLNRVILLSDGMANVGVTDPKSIATEVKALASQGVSTSTMGLGEDYNEDLMQAMGEAGDGNYHYIESPLQLLDIFQTELLGLMTNLGQKVRLGLESLGGSVVVELLNDLEKDPQGEWILPNLVVGMPLSIVARLKIPPLGTTADLCRIRLSWDRPTSGERQVLFSLLTLGSCPSSQWEKLPSHPEVVEQVAFQLAARARREAIAAYDQGDLSTSLSIVQEINAQMKSMPSSPSIDAELANLDLIETDLHEGHGSTFRKRTAEQAFRRKRGLDR